MVEECSLKVNMIGELKRENLEFEKKIKLTQELYESVRKDKNVFSQALNKSQDANVAFRKQFTITNQKVMNLKNEQEQIQLTLS